MSGDKIYRYSIFRPDNVRYSRHRPPTDSRDENESDQTTTKRRPNERGRALITRNLWARVERNASENGVALRRYNVTGVKIRLATEKSERKKKSGIPKDFSINLDGTDIVRTAEFLAYKYVGT